MEAGFTNILIGLVALHILLIVTGIGYFLIYRVFRRADEKRRSWRYRLVRGLLVPVNFTAIFLERRNESSLPLYFRLFLRFTRFCSKIPYFHFLPKFLVATVSEFIIHLLTGKELLTGLLFLWSMSFFMMVSFVESKYGELEEEAITLANKIFLFSVSLLTIVVLIIGTWFWPVVQPFFENPFWRFVASVAAFFNQMLAAAIAYALVHPWLLFGGFILLSIYIASSLFLSEYLKRKHR